MLTTAIFAIHFTDSITAKILFPLLSSSESVWYTVIERGCTYYSKALTLGQGLKNRIKNIQQEFIRLCGQPSMPGRITDNFFTHQLLSPLLKERFDATQRRLYC
jgi:hypothetical protein